MADKLLTYAELLALHKGYNTISLTVEINNTSAQRLYQKQCYDYVDETGEDDIKVYKMRKYLG
ncbi:GNAT family N-acetyltransferase [Staphylococcus equorum]|uniref:GNAT family N-acetyltransferase n=1 Tax=Staphylococcus equorum TaxID=246432 RepID=UPI003D803CCA